MRIYCSGDSGVWKCKDAIGDHMVDISRFTKETNTARGLQTSCVDCVKSYNDRNNFNRDAYYMEGAKLLNLPKINEEQFYNLLGKKERTLCRDIVRGKETQEIEAEAWLRTIFPVQPKDDLPAAKPSRKRISAAYDKPLPKEGWVYVMHTGLYNKIGKTWENGLRARRAEARRGGPADLVYWAWFDDAMAAEKEIHRRLKRYKVEKENVGEELFDCTVDVAKDEINKLQEELENYAREKQKVG